MLQFTLLLHVYWRNVCVYLRLYRSIQLTKRTVHDWREKKERMNEKSTSIKHTRTHHPNIACNGCDLSDAGIFMRPFFSLPPSLYVLIFNVHVRVRVRVCWSVPTLFRFSCVLFILSSLFPFHQMDPPHHRWIVLRHRSSFGRTISFCDASIYYCIHIRIIFFGMSERTHLSS